MKIEFALNNYSDLELYDFVKKEGQSTPKRLTLLLKEVLRLLSIKKEREEYCIEYEQTKYLELNTVFCSRISEELEILKIHIPKLETLEKFILDELKELEIYTETFENLKKDSNYKNEYIENPESFPDIELDIRLKSQRKGYERAIRDFNSLNQEPTRTKTETSNSEKEQKELTENKPKYTPSELLINYHYWDNVNTKTHGYINIFNNITEQQFFEMIDNADFSTIIGKHGYSKRIKYNIAVLSRILGKEWGEIVAKKLKTTLKKCAKCSGFHEFSAIKNMYKP